MTHKLMLTTAVSALMLTAAVAQTPVPETSPPAGNSPAQSTEGAMNPPATAPNGTGDKLRTETQVAPDRDKATFLPAQGTDRWVFSKFSGIDVIGPDDKKIGDVSDLVFDKNHTIIAYVVGVGGFLGLGEKNVAIEPAAFTVWRDPKETRNHPSLVKLKVSWTKEQLEKAPTFEYYREPSPAVQNKRPGLTGSVPRETRPAPSN